MRAVDTVYVKGDTVYVKGVHSSYSPELPTPGQEVGARHCTASYLPGESQCDGLHTNENVISKKYNKWSTS